MLDNFFRINLPYGIARDAHGRWMAFNREYMPLGYSSLKDKSDPGYAYLELPIYTYYKGLTEKLLLEIADGEKNVLKDEVGKIQKIWLYDDNTNPVNQSKHIEKYWQAYFAKLTKLSKLKVMDQSL